MLRIYLIFFFLSLSLLWGHTIKPAYLSILSSGDTSYTIVWKVSTLNNRKNTLSPIFPPMCKQNNIQSIHAQDYTTTYSTLNCQKPLFSHSISIQNISKELMQVIFHFKQNNVSYFSQFDPTTTSLVIKNKKIATTWETVKSYIFLGIEHILTGYDHLLFILSLVLLIHNTKMLLLTITAFTLAHSVTLGATAMHWIHAPSTFIEQLIALSILLLATELYYAEKNKFGLSSHYPWVIAFFFGLIHGFGFASALSELGLPQNHLLLSLVSFNAGIELGQLFFIACLLILMYVSKYMINEKHRHLMKLFTIYFIGTMAFYWLIERLL